MSSHRFGPMETGRDMSAMVLLRPPKSLHDASLEPMVCRHAHNLPAKEEWRSSVDGVTEVWQTKRRLLDTLIHKALLYGCAEVSIGKQTTEDEREKSVASVKPHSFLFWAHRSISFPRSKEIVSPIEAVRGHLPAFPFLCRFPGTP